MKSGRLARKLPHIMPRRISISAGEPHLWEKLEQMTHIDPAVTGGVREVVLGRRIMKRSEPIPAMFATGFEEIHEIDRGFCAHVADVYMEQDWRMTISSRENNLRFRIAYAGEATYFDRKRRLSGDTLGCSYIIRPAGDSLTATFEGGTQYRYCSLNVTQSYLTQTLGLANDELPKLLLAHWERRESVMGLFPASKASLALASRFFSTHSSSGWRDLEVRAIALDLLRMLFENWRHASPRLRSSMRITPLERAKLSQILELIKENPGGTYTIPALCRQFQMNRKKLHHGFKRLCGVSIHDFQTELRMEAALAMLRSGSLPIAQIAERCGFSEPTNFTAAFKKHFAVLPKQVRERKASTP